MQTKADTTYVSIPIEYIRLANKKLLERNYLLEVNAYKDSIIVDYKNYISEYEKANNDYVDRLETCIEINKELNKSLEKQKKTSLVLGSVAGTSVILLILTSMLN